MPALPTPSRSVIDPEAIATELHASHERLGADWVAVVVDLLERKVIAAGNDPSCPVCGAPRRLWPRYRSRFQATCGSEECRRVLQSRARKGVALRTKTLTSEMAAYRDAWAGLKPTSDDPVYLASYTEGEDDRRRAGWMRNGLHPTAARPERSASKITFAPHRPADQHA